MDFLSRKLLNDSYFLFRSLDSTSQFSFSPGLLKSPNFLSSIVLGEDDVDAGEKSLLGDGCSGSLPNGVELSELLDPGVDSGGVLGGDDKTGEVARPIGVKISGILGLAGVDLLLLLDSGASSLMGSRDRTSILVQGPFGFPFQFFKIPIFQDLQ